MLDCEAHTPTTMRLGVHHATGGGGLPYRQCAMRDPRMPSHATTPRRGAAAACCAVSVGRRRRDHPGCPSKLGACVSPIVAANLRVWRLASLATLRAARPAAHLQLQPVALGEHRTEGQLQQRVAKEALGAWPVRVLRAR